MSQKIVAQGENACTVALAGEETAVIFHAGAPFFWVKNTGNSELYAAVKSGANPGDDGVYPIPAGENMMVPAGNDSKVIYLSGAGSALVIASPIAACPFKSAGKGGGSGGEILLTYCLFGIEKISEISVGNIFEEV